MIEMKAFVPICPPNKSNKRNKVKNWNANSPLYILPTIYGEKEYADKRYEVTIELHFKGYQEVDVDNCMKTVLDSLKGRWMYDDRQIKHLKIPVFEKSDKFGVGIYMKEIDDSFPQSSIFML